MKKLFYLFRKPVIREIALAKLGKYPKDFFYGFTELSKLFTLSVSDLAENSKYIRYIHILTNKLISRFLNINISLVQVLLQYNKLNKSEVIFTTVDSYGIAVSLLKSLGFLRKQKLVFNTIGLCDILVYLNEKKPVIFTLYKTILKKVDLFISGASKTECITMAKLLSYSNEKFIFIPFGIDTKYFSPMRIEEKNYSLIIGADSKRDWDLYLRLFKSFSREKFIVITHPNLFKQESLSNVRVIYNLPIGEVRDYMTEAKMVIILSKQNYHFAGQSTSFRAMSMGKAVIFTKSYGVEEYGFKNNQECIMISPGDWVSLQRAFLKLNNNSRIRKKIGLNGMAKIIRDLSIKQYTNKLARVLSSL